MPPGSTIRDPAFKKAVAWPKRIQNGDGGWGEDCASYKLDYTGYEKAPSTASQTAWALLGLMAAGEVDEPAVARGIRYLLAAQEGDGSWQEEHFTGNGFSKGILPALPRLREVLSALGGSALPQSEAREPQYRAGRHLDRRTVLAITGMKAEARIAAGADVSVIASGGRKETLESALDDVFEAHVGAVLSFGIAGGLAPGLRPGTVLIARPSSPRTANNSNAIAPGRSDLRQLSAAPRSSIWRGIDRPVTTPADKRALHLSTRAAVADMESHIAARFAAARNLPFAAFRVVADPAERHVPPAALAGISPTGAVAAGPVLRALARAPGQIPHLVKTAFDANAAFVSLFRSRQMTSVGGFGFFDFSELVLDVPREDVIGGSLPV